MIQKMANNSLFERWRPYSHFSAPAGWMNDPCGPLYDPIGKTYHMHYQWHPDHVEWGNISWGHATSDDMVTWTDINHFPGNHIQAWSGHQAQSIGTSNLTSNKHVPQKYNILGIFSGTAQPVNLTGGVDGTLLTFYTSVSRGPLSWDQPYPADAESQSLTYSTDQGVTWTDYDGNPVINHLPVDWNITGFRDPFFHDSPELDTMLNYSEPHYYAIFGSGIGDVGPRIPLYTAPASNLTTWSYLGALWEPNGNTSLGQTYETGTWGWNFELPNLFKLGEHWFFSSGVEGGSTDYHEQNWVVWNEGIVSARLNGSVAFQPISMGASDWGLLYAITSFNDTKNNRRVQIGWAREDMNGFGIVQQGYQGALSIPRELFVMNTPSIILPMRNTSSVYTRQSNGTYTARTMGARPAQDIVLGLRNGSNVFNCTVHSFVGKGNGYGSNMLMKAMNTSYEVSMTIDSTRGRTGLTIGASPDFQEFTSIYYDPATSTIACDRTNSSTIKEFLNTTYVGFFEPYNISGKSESVRFTVFVDGSLVEIFVNDRFALTSRIYPSRLDSSGLGIYAAPGVNVTYSGPIRIWDGLRNVWPHRPRNSSSLLVYDTDQETNNRTWWSGL
ncbi:hypothetical protein A1O1_06686 [Capronia coronata CBS 617.96]|uniref:Beta-fructofuranosidase n=1 Tax=Capronia coronata CBS 617.96 TaxID=1182541 RepID=W9XS66_9EURO|nr:uncharacterized protein A1O1_06686 [Capronia coronata CBS 617.96]EXJ83068.1 hypothetical protein A1O1_06686 [Capronia coronata CBS 617.96]